MAQVTAESMEVEDINRASLEVYENGKKAVIETEELTSVVRKLRLICQQERQAIELLRSQINQLGGLPSNRFASLAKVLELKCREDISLMIG